jgi:hypothetical protein
MTYYKKFDENRTAESYSKDEIKGFLKLLNWNESRVIGALYQLRDSVDVGGILDYYNNGIYYFLEKVSREQILGEPESRIILLTNEGGKPTGAKEEKNNWMWPPLKEWMRFSPAPSFKYGKQNLTKFWRILSKSLKLKENFWIGNMAPHEIQIDSSLLYEKIRKACLNADITHLPSRRTIEETIISLANQNLVIKRKIKTVKNRKKIVYTLNPKFYAMLRRIWRPPMYST